MAIYIMGLSWWHEVVPKIETQRIARLALISVIEGTSDLTTGTYAIGSASYKRRNGIIQATLVPNLPSINEIDFALAPDTSNVRAFYLGIDPDTGFNVVYYKDSSGTAHKLNSTVGITELTFEKYSGSDNVIKVTATAERDVTGTRSDTYHIRVSYSQIVYLRNVRS